MSICLEVTKQQCISLANGCVRWLSECSVANLPKSKLPFFKWRHYKRVVLFWKYTNLFTHATVCKWLVLKYTQWKSLIEGSCFVYIRRWITAIAKSKIFVCAVSSAWMYFQAWNMPTFEGYTKFHCLWAFCRQLFLHWSDNTAMNIWTLYKLTLIPPYCTLAP